MPGMTIDPDDDIIWTPHGILFVAQRRKIYPPGPGNGYYYEYVSNGRRARFEVQGGGWNKAHLMDLISDDYQYNILKHFDNLIVTFKNSSINSDFDMVGVSQGKISLMIFDGTNSYNHGTISTPTVFKNGSFNNGTMDNDNVNRSTIFITATNTVNGVVQGRATFRTNSYNYGTLTKTFPLPGSCAFIFRTGSVNSGTITGNASFYNTRNYGTLNNDGLFSGTQARNTGLIKGHAVLINGASNQGGIVEGPLRFRNTTSFPSITRFGTHSAVYFGHDDTAIEGTDIVITIGTGKYTHIQGDHISNTKTAGDWLIANGTTNINQYTSNNNRNGQWGYNINWFASELLAQQEKAAHEWLIELGANTSYYQGEGARNAQWAFNLTWYGTGTAGYNAANLAALDYTATVWLSTITEPTRYEGEGTYNFYFGYKNIWYTDNVVPSTKYYKDLADAFLIATGMGMAQFTVEPFFEGMSGNRSGQWAYNKKWYSNTAEGRTTALTLIADTWLTNNGLNVTQYFIQEQYLTAVENVFWIRNGEWGYNKNWYTTQQSAQMSKDFDEATAWAVANGTDVNQYTGSGTYNNYWGYNGSLYPTQEQAQNQRDTHIAAAVNYAATAGATIFLWSGPGVYKNKYGYNNVWYDTQTAAQAARNADDAVAATWLLNNGTNITQYTGAGSKNGKWGYNNLWYDTQVAGQNEINEADAATWLLNNGLNVNQYTGPGSKNGKWGYNNLWYDTEAIAQAYKTSADNAAIQAAWLLNNGLNVNQYVGVGTQNYKWGYNNTWYDSQSKALNVLYADEYNSSNWLYYNLKNVSQYTGTGSKNGKWGYNNVWYDTQTAAQAIKDADVAQAVIDEANAATWLANNGTNITQYTGAGIHKDQWGYNNVWYWSQVEAQDAAGV